MLSERRKHNGAVQLWRRLRVFLETFKEGKPVRNQQQSQEITMKRAAVTVPQSKEQENHSQELEGVDQSHHRHL